MTGAGIVLAFSLAIAGGLQSTPGLPTPLGQGVSPLEYVGTLEPTLTVEPALVPLPCEPILTRADLKLPVRLRAKDFVCEGKLFLGPTKPGLRVVVVEPVLGRPFAFVDLDGDGTFTAAEQVAFGPMKAEPRGARGEATVQIPRAGPPFPSHPVRIVLTNNRDGQQRIFHQSFLADARGSVEIGGRRVLVQYRVPIDADHIDPAHCGVGMDLDGDGTIGRSRFSLEWGEAEGEPVIFRIGDTYVSTKLVDLQAGRFVLQSRDPAEYVRLELAVGKQVADFAFVDLEGRTRSLWEFRAKYLLMEFWGTWCGPCIADIPYLKEAYERYQPLGLEIIGLDSEDSKNAEAVKQFLAEKGATWPQAESESVKTLVDKRFMVSTFPTLVLLDADHRIVSLDQIGLRQKELLQTLEKLFAERR